MTVPPGGQPHGQVQGYGPAYPGYPPPPRRKSPLPWLVGVAVVVIAAVAVTLVLALGGDDDTGGRPVPPGARPVPAGATT